MKKRKSSVDAMNGDKGAAPETNSEEVSSADKASGEAETAAAAEQDAAKSGSGGGILKKSSSTTTDGGLSRSMSHS